MTVTNSGDPLYWKRQISVWHVTIYIHPVPVESTEFDGDKMAEVRLELVGYQQLGFWGVLYSFYFDVSTKSLKHAGDI